MAEVRPQGTSTDPLKIPPHSLEAEQAVLGGLMVDNDAWDRVAEQVAEGDFYRRDHRLLFRAMAELAEASQPVDMLTVSDWLKRSDLLEEAGGLHYIGLLAQETPSAANIKAYAAIVREKSVLRQLIAAGTEVATSGYQPEGRGVPELLDEAERRIFSIAEQTFRGQAGPVPIKTILPDVVDKLDELFAHQGEVTGVATGFADFDRVTSGLQSGDLIIVAGRPSMGKTSFAMNIAEHVALSGSKPVVVFSMEMPGDSLVLRMLASLGRVELQKVRSGQLEGDDWSRLTSTMTLLGEAKLFIDDGAALSPHEVRARARRLAREHDLGLIVVDYLQLMQVPGFRENRTAEISEISRSLKALAKDLNLPVIALSQLNRSLEQRPNKRPVMSDLRESGAIEQDADLISFIYRDEVYHPDTAEKGKAELIIGKHRNGPIGTVPLTFLGRYTRFESYIEDVYGGEVYS